MWSSKFGSCSGASPHAGPRNIEACPRVCRQIPGADVTPVIDGTGHTYIPAADSVFVLGPDLSWRSTIGPLPDGTGLLLASPALDGGLLFLATSEGYAFCYDVATRERKWGVKYCAACSQDPWALAAACGMVVAAGRTSKATDADQWNNTVFVLDAARGSVRWSYEVKVPPLLLFAPCAVDDLLLFKEFRGQVNCLKIKTGKPHWQLTPEKSGLSTGGVAASKELALVFVATNLRGGKMSWNTPYGGKGVVHAYTLQQGKHVWTQPLAVEANTKPCILLRQGDDAKRAVVVVAAAANPSSLKFNDERLAPEPWQGEVVGLGASDGALLWTFRDQWYGPRGNPDFRIAVGGDDMPIGFATAWSHPVCDARGTVYCAWMCGRLRAIDGATGEVISTWFDHQIVPCISTPAIAPGRLVVKHPRCNHMCLWDDAPWDSPFPEKPWGLFLEQGEVLQDLAVPFSESGTEHFWPCKAGDGGHPGKPKVGRMSADVSRPAWCYDHSPNRSEGLDGMENTPLVDAQGNVYANSRFSTSLMVYKPDGTLRGRLHVGASCQTPALLGKYIYGNNWCGFAWKADLETLKMVWKKRYCVMCCMDSWSAMALPLESSEEGVLVVVGNVGQSPGLNHLLVGLDTITGEPRWHYTFSPGRNVYNNMPSILGDRMFISDSDGGQFCFNWHDGTLVWDSPPAEKASFTCCFMAVGPNGLGYDGWNLDRPPSPNNPFGGHGRFKAFHLSDGSTKWVRDWDMEVHTAPLVLPAGDGCMLVVHLGGMPQGMKYHAGFAWSARLEGLDADTGETIWGFDVPIHRSSLVRGETESICSLPDCWSSCTLGSDGTIYTCWMGGVVYALEGTTGRLLSECDLANMGPGSLSMAPGLMAYMSTNRLTCWRDAGAEREWREEAAKAGDPRALVPWPEAAPELADHERRARDAMSREKPNFISEGATEEGIRQQWIDMGMLQPQAEESKAAPPQPLPEGSSPGRGWVVVGGADAGGILVRIGKALKSNALDGRLQTGAKVEEIERDGDRLHYKKLDGAGPDFGWVSCTFKGKQLLAVLDKS